MDKKLMRDTRPAIIKLVILTMMLAGLLSILPDKPSISGKPMAAAHQALDKMQQPAISNKSTPAATVQTSPHPIHTKTNIDSNSDNTASLL